MYLGEAVEFWNTRRVLCLTKPFISHFIYVIPLVEIFDKLLNPLVCLKFYTWWIGIAEGV